YKGIVACIADGCSSAKFAKEAANLSVSHFINEYLATEHSWSVKKISIKSAGEFKFVALFANTD
ncbi:hypothetical protein ACJBV1_11080, partial [Streptococcus suis]